MLADVMVLLNRLADKAIALLGNFTTNLAESWMAIRAKFDGGKINNRCQRGSWHARCFGAGLRRNVGIQWSPLVWRKLTGIEPSKPMESHFAKLSRKQEVTKLSKSRPDVRDRSRKRHMSRMKE